MIAAGIALLMILLILYWRLYQPSTQLVGYAMITMGILFLGAVQLICLGILGEYVGRIYDEVKIRPTYTLKEKVGFDEETFNLGVRY